jgi:hypothetical protein
MVLLGSAAQQLPSDSVFAEGSPKRKIHVLTIKRACRTTHMPDARAHPLMLTYGQPCLHGRFVNSNFSILTGFREGTLSLKMRKIFKNQTIVKVAIPMSAKDLWLSLDPR